jgi:hypothetical protein
MILSRPKKRACGAMQLPSSVTSTALTNFRPRLAASGDPRLASIKVNAIDPGLMPATGLTRSYAAPMQWIVRNVMPLLRLINDNVHSPETSAKRVAALTIGEDAAPGGRYFRNGKAVRSSEASYDQGKARELWVSSAAMTGLPSEITDVSKESRSEQKAKS